ncbi:MAG: Hsp70 family protein [Planctomycetaceae bacterium]|nr:Hsp70 family protein [Planctomycetaceae bacterium]
MSDTRRRTPIGIDLGTTFSLVAWVDAQGRPQTITNAEGDLTTPSVVFFDRDSAIVGKEAVKAAEFEPDRIAQFAKRDMGNLYFHKQIRGEDVPPEVVQSLILKKLRDDAQLRLGSVKQAVITVPAYFNEPRRKATQDAGKLAGLDVLDIVNEPTAAAIAYGVEQGFLQADGNANTRQTVLVYDLGGGTFDVTLMDLQGRQFDTVATAGDVFLGGIDWDQRIVDFIAEKFVTEHGIDPRQDESDLQRLLHEAEDVKRSLTSRAEVHIHFAAGGKRLRTALSRDEFETLTGDLLDRTQLTTERVLREAGRTWRQVDRLLLVGGSSRMPMVAEMLERISGMQVDRSLSPDEAVAHGAAVYAAWLTSDEVSEAPTMSIRNVNSHDLGVLGIERATGRQRRQLMIARNTPLPATQRHVFPTLEDDQRSVVVNVVEGGDASGNQATSIGKCLVSGLPAGLPARTPVEVTFEYAENGRLMVQAWLPTINKAATLEIERASGLSEERYAAWAPRVEQGLPDQTLTGQDSNGDATSDQPEVALDASLPVSSFSGNESASETPPPPTTRAERAEVATVSPPATAATPHQQTQPVAPHTAPVVPKSAVGAATTNGRGATKLKSPITAKSPAQEISRSPRPPRPPVKFSTEPAIEVIAASNATTADAITATSLLEAPSAESTPSSPAASRRSKSHKLSPPVASAAPPKATVESSAAPEVEEAIAAATSMTAVDELIEREVDPEEEKQKARQKLYEQLTVHATNLLLHGLVLLALGLILLPNQVRDQFVTITSTISTEQPETLQTLDLSDDMLEPMQEAATVTDVLAMTEDKLDVDINDLNLAAPNPEVKTEGPGSPVKIQGELGGRSEAGRAALVAREGGNSASEAAVASGLKWLQSIQQPDGSWSFAEIGGAPDAGSYKKCYTGATAMALLCYLGAGQTHEKGDYQETVGKAVNFLLKSIKSTPAGGDLRGEVEGNEGMYVQGLCAIALCEAHGLTKDRRLHQACIHVIGFIISAQDPSGGGWRYKPLEKGDTSVVGWQLMALQSAAAAKIRIPPNVSRGVAYFLDSVQAEGGSQYGYTGPQAGRPGTSAVGLLCRMYLGWDKEQPGLVGGVAYLSKTGPSKSDIYYNYYATQVLHHWGGEEWKKWNLVMRDRLINTQTQEGPAAGSWKPTGGHGSKQGGRLFETCLSIMTLEVYYRHLPLYKREATQVEF